MEACFGNPLTFVLTHWWQMGLMIIGCAVAIACADFWGLTRPWPLSVILGGILTQIIGETYPCPQLVLGSYTFIPVWVIITCATYFLPMIAAKRASFPKSTIWDYFEEVDSTSSTDSTSEKGASPWVEYSNF